MQRLLAGIALALAMTVIIPVQAQAPWPTTAQPPSPVVTYPDVADRYRFVAPTPSDAYRQGLITRFELEQLEGPLPPALQGPSPNGKSGFGGSN